MVISWHEKLAVFIYKSLKRDLTFYTVVTGFLKISEHDNYWNSL